MKKTLLLIFFTVLFSSIFCQDFDAELTNNQTDITIANGNLIQNESYEIRIYNRSGERFSKVSIPFSKLHKISKLEAFIKDSKGEIVRKLKNNEITERSNISNFSLYEDDYVKEFTLKYNEYPYSICYSYQIQETEFIDIARWFPIIDTEIPTKNAELTLTIPKDYSIRFQNRFVNSPEIESSDKKTTYRWKTTYNQKLKSEKFAPKLSEFAPSVIIIANDFRYAETGSFRNWNEYRNWAFKLSKNINNITEDEKVKINGKISGINDDVEKIRTLYHYLQDNTRYVNVSIDKGGVVPYPASYVCENKYGDCKALTNYFKSILSFAGIKSYYTYVYADNIIPKIDTDFPLDKFNHVILYVPLKNDTIWLDCTSKGPFDYLGTFTQNRYALTVDNVNEGLIHTPKLSPTDVLETRNISVFYEKDKPTKVNFENRYKGEMFEKIEQLETSFNSKEKDNILREYFVQDEMEMTDYNISKKDRDDKNIQFNYQATSANIYKKYGNEIVVNNIDFDIPKIEKPSARKLPLQINYPVNKSDTIQYNIPEGYVLSDMCQNITLEDSPFGTYNMKFTVKENTIQVIKNMLIKAGEYPLSDYQKFYDFCNKILNFEKSKHIILKPKN